MLQARPGRLTVVCCSFVVLPDIGCPTMRRSAPSPTVQRWLAGGLIVLLAALAVARSWYGTRLDSFTIDEPWHIVAGTVYVRGGDRHLNPEHPPLAKLWVGAWMPAAFRVGPEPGLREKAQERE